MKLLPILLLIATSAGAADTSTTMAALNGEKAECRYLMSLCEDVVAATKTQSADVASRKLKALGEAAEVLLAKHDKRPACLAECDARLGTVLRK